MKNSREKEIILGIEDIGTIKLPIENKYNIIFELETSDLNEISGKQILRFLKCLLNKGVSFKVINALPPCLFDFKNRIIIQKLGFLKNCLDCEKLFRVNSFNEVIFCNGKKGKYIDYYDNLDSLFHDFLESNKYSLIPTKCKDCKLINEYCCSYGCIFRKNNFQILYTQEDLFNLKFRFGYSFFKKQQLKKDIFKPTRIFICPTYKCSNKCLHCFLGDKNKWIDPDIIFLREMIHKYSKEFPVVDFSGGEPTLCRYLPELITLSKNNGFIVHMFSNGRRFKDKGYVKNILETGIDSITITIHNHISDKHNFITQREKSFQEMVKGIENLQCLNFRGLRIQIIVHKQNYQDLFETVKFALLFKPMFITFVPIIFNGNAIKNFGIMSIKLNTVVPYLKEAFQFIIEKKSNLIVSSFPLCLFRKKYWPYFLNSRYTVLATNHLSPDMKGICGYTTVGLSLGKRCVSCNVKKFCPGTWEPYYYFYGDKEFTPQN